MTIQSIKYQAEQFLDVDGKPLDNGKVYIGTAGVDPIANPVQLYWDEAKTSPATQPLTISGGYVKNGGAIAAVYVDADDYSMEVQNKNTTTTFSTLNTLERVSSSNIVYKGEGTGADNRSLSSKLGDLVSVKDFGAVGDQVNDDTTAIQECATHCTANNKTMFLPDGIYYISSALTIGCSIIGTSPNNAIILNAGTGNALDCSTSNYYSLFQNFQVKGNTASQDGIVLYNASGNVAYAHFSNVYCIDHGRHGLVHRNAWATRYHMCKFQYNGAGTGGGCGVYVQTESGDAGTANGVSFFQCDARHNGGGITDYGATSYNADAGGIKIKGGANVSWDGGIIESNNPWGVNVQGQAFAALRVVSFNDVYAEFNGPTSALGGYIYVGSNTLDVEVSKHWAAINANAGNTNYFIYNASTAIIEDRTNFVTKLGSGGTELYNPPSLFSNKYAQKWISKPFGDLAAAGTPTTQDVVEVTGDGLWTIKGFIHCKRDSDTTGGIFPFVASYQATGGRNVAVGSSIVGTATTAPTMAFSSDELQVTLANFHYAYIELDDGGIHSSPTTLDYDTTIFDIPTLSSEYFRRK